MDFRKNGDKEWRYKQHNYYYKETEDGDLPVIGFLGCR
jgi:hypothetical protein